MLNIEPNSASNRFRQRRFSRFRKIIDQVVAEKGACKVLDIGGTAAFWDTFGTGLDWKNLHVVILNLFADGSANERIEFVSGDARDVKEFPDQAFDVVHSNSVIEHVGSFGDKMRMAKEVRRLAPRHFIQTPYFWFPIEPHARFPFFHWLPEPLRYRLVMNRTCGFWQRQADLSAAMMTIHDASLLDKTQMRFLFPESAILSETFIGLTKSIIAVK